MKGKKAKKSRKVENLFWLVLWWFQLWYKRVFSFFYCSSINDVHKFVRGNNCHCGRFVYRCFILGHSLSKDKRQVIKYNQIKKVEEEMEREEGDDEKDLHDTCSYINPTFDECPIPFSMFQYMNNVFN